MVSMILRAAVPTTLFLVGLGSLIYGVKYHSAPVSQEQEIEVSIAPPAPFAPGGSAFGLFPGDPSLDGPPPMIAPPPPLLNTVKQKIVVTGDEPESALIREVTFGGVTLLASGHIKRTYSGKPPSLCPT